MAVDRSLNTADRIMNAAQLLVQQRGFHGFSFRDIAAAVGIRSASIHYHFPTKPDLARAVLARVRTDFEQELLRIDREITGTRAKLEAFAGLFVETYADGDRLCPFCMVACAQHGVPESVRDEVEAFWLHGEAWVGEVLAETAGPDDGRLLVAARTFVAGLEGAMVTARAFDDRQRLLDSASWLIERLTDETHPLLDGPTALDRRN